MDLCNLTVKQAVKGLKAKEFSAAELKTACLARIRRLNPELKAILTVVEREKTGGKRKKGALEGVPFTVKDLFVTQDVRTTAGSRVLKDYIPEYEATTVKRLKEAGAVLIGKTNCDAWGHGSSGENSDFGVTKNPWNPLYSPGGSSSGSAAAVASGMGLFSLGTDTGGSIRLPASFCGLTGLKPTYGRVSRYGVIALASSLDCPGPLGKTVEDVETVFEIMAGKDEYDATTLQNEELRMGKEKVVIGVPQEYFGKGIDREVRSAVETAIGVLGECGNVREVRLPRTEYALAAYYLIQTAEASSNLARYDGIRYGRDRASFGDEAKRRIMLGTYALSAGYFEAYYKKAMRARTLIKEDFEKVFKEVDLLMAPVSPTPAFKLGEKIDDPLRMYMSDVLTVPANLAGIPALALPCGFSRLGLPMGMQIMGPQGSESLLFEAGKRYQKTTEWHLKKPAPAVMVVNRYKQNLK